MEINGERAPEGTIVVAKISGEEVCSYNLGSDSQYKMVVEGTPEDTGKEIGFYINDVKADQTAEWEAGSVTLDLSVSIPDREEFTTSSTSSTVSSTSSSTTLSSSGTSSTTTSTIVETTTTSAIPEESTTLPKPPNEGQGEINPKVFLLAILGIILVLLLSILAVIMKRN